MTLLKSSAVRRRVHERSGVQVSDDALEVLERHLEAIISKAEDQTASRDRKRLDGITMRAVVHDAE